MIERDQRLVQHMVYVLPTKHVLNALRPHLSSPSNLLSIPFTHPHTHTHTHTHRHTQTHTQTHTHGHTQTHTRTHTQRLVSGIDLRVKATLFQCNGMQDLNKVYKTGVVVSSSLCSLFQERAHKCSLWP